MEFIVILGYVFLVFIIWAVGFSNGHGFAEEKFKKQADDDREFAYGNGYLEGVSNMSRILDPILTRKEKEVERLFDELKKKDKLIKDLTDDSKKA